MIRNLLVVFTILSPIVAYVFWTLKDMNNKRWYVLASIPILAVTVYIAHHPLQVPNVTSWLHYYGLYLLVYLTLIGQKFKYKHFNKALALSVMALFIAGDLWEIPEFIYDFVFKHGGVADMVWWMSHVRRLYTLATFILFCKLGRIRFDRVSVLLFVFATVSGFLFLLPSVHMFPEQTTAARITYLLAFGLITYRGVSEPDEA